MSAELCLFLCWGTSHVSQSILEEVWVAYFSDDRAGGAVSQRKYSSGGFMATIQNRLQGFFPYKKHGQSYSFPSGLFQMNRVTRLDFFNKLKHSRAVL